MMKKKILEFTIVILVLNGCMALAGKKNMTATGVTQFTVLDKGIKRTILIPNRNSSKTKTTRSINQQNPNQKQGIIVSFYTILPTTISDFETKYHVKLKTELLNTYYIFTNNSKMSDVSLIQTIIKNETNVKTLKPNWRMHNTIR
jgi:hypothetical protein